MIWFKGGLVTGPAFGALGAWWKRTRSLGASALAGALLVAEPFTVLGAGWGERNAPAYAVFALEIAAGAALLALAQRARRASSSST